MSGPSINEVIATYEIAELDRLYESDVVCTSRAQHDCTIYAVYTAKTLCNKELLFWCMQRYNDYIKNGAELLHALCKQPQPACFRIKPLG